MGFYARILIQQWRNALIEEVNEELMSMYVEPRTKLRLDVDYVIGRLENIDRWKDIEEFINELKQNMENHNGN